MKILGIDPGSNASGYALLEAMGPSMRLIECGVLRPGRNAGFAGRLAEIDSALADLVCRLGPDEAAVEDLFHSVNARSALRLAHARGVILSVLSRSGLPVAEYTPVQVKKAVSGYGLADKAALRDLIERLLSVPKGVLSKDASDAAAVALCHAQVVPFRDAILAADAGNGRKKDRIPHDPRTGCGDRQ